MERREELRVLIKSLLCKIEMLFKDGLDLENEFVVAETAKELHSISLQVTKYNQELEEIIYKS